MSRPRALLVLPVVLLALAAGGCAGDDNDDAAESTPTTTTAPVSSGGTCKPVGRPKTKPETGNVVPETHLSSFKTYDVIVETNCGTFTIRLDTQTPSRTVVSFAELARKGFFDGTIFHRIVPGFVAQGGDPTQSGRGGPGYHTIDPPAASTRYTKGVVAMAKLADERPGTAGSQFFIVTAPDAELSPDFAVIGKVVKGMDVVQRIGRRGTAQDEHGDPIPSKNPVVVRDMRLVVS